MANNIFDYARQQKPTPFQATTFGIEEAPFAMELPLGVAPINNGAWSGYGGDLTKSMEANQNYEMMQVDPYNGNEQLSGAYDGSGRRQDGIDAQSKLAKDPMDMSAHTTRGYGAQAESTKVNPLVMMQALKGMQKEKAIKPYEPVQYRGLLGV